MEEGKGERTLARGPPSRPVASNKRPRAVVNSPASSAMKWILEDPAPNFSFHAL